MLHYNISLLDVVEGTCPYPPRLVLDLIDRLPEDSHYRGELQGNPELAHWPTSTHLLAAIANAVTTGNLLFLGANSSKKAPNIDPILPPQPSAEWRRRNAPKASQFKANLDPRAFE